MVNPWPTVSNSVRIQATSQSAEGAQRAGEASVEAAVKGRTRGIRREAGRGIFIYTVIIYHYGDKF